MLPIRNIQIANTGKGPAKKLPREEVARGKPGKAPSKYLIQNLLVTKLEAQGGRPQKPEPM